MSLWNKIPWKKVGFKNTKEYTLLQNEWVENFCLPKGLTVKVRQTNNFGWIILPVNTKDIYGNNIPKRIFNY